MKIRDLDEKFTGLESAITKENDLRDYEDEEIIFIRSVATFAASGIRNWIYECPRIAKQIQVVTKPESMEVDSILVKTIKESTEKRQKIYAAKVGKLCKKYDVPFNIGLAIGTEEAKFIGISSIHPYIDKTELHELLDCGIERRKKACKEILGEQIYDLINIEEMGQLNSQKIAQYIAYKRSNK